MAEGTAAEKLLRATLWDFGIRYRTSETLEGVSPTLTIPSALMVVFVSDCYDARCPWDYPERKSSRAWKKTNDLDSKLRKDGWIVMRVWQHEVEATPRLVAGRIALVYRAVIKAIEMAQD